MTAADWINRRRELLDDASPGPWVTTADGADTLSAGFNPDGHLCLYAGFGWDDDAALIADARTSLPLALDALDAVLAQHRPVSYAATANCGLVLYEVCPTCHDKARVHLHICAECNKTWPCATAEAIETALAGGCGQCRQIDGHHKLDCGRRTT